MVKFFIVKNDYKVTNSKFETLQKTLLAEGFVESEQNPDIVFVIGGDGTFLKAVHMFQKQLPTIKFVPFKSGGLGFYTNRNAIEELPAIINAIKAKKMHEVSYELLELKNGKQTHYICNELKILNEKTILHLKIFVNNEYLETFHGTGIVLATANGSTGYMKSAGGAVILPKNSQIYQLQELVPVSTNKYRTLNAPLILDKSQVLTLELETCEDIIICDTQQREIKSRVLEVKMSDKRVSLLTLTKIELNSEINLLRQMFIKDKEVIE